MKEVDRLALGTTGAVRLTWNLETLPNFLGWKAGGKIILGDHWQVGPDAKQIVGIVNSGRLSPFGTGVRLSPKVMNLLQSSLAQLFTLLIGTKPREAVEVGPAGCVSPEVSTPPQAADRNLAALAEEPLYYMHVRTLAQIVSRV